MSTLYSPKMSDGQLTELAHRQMPFSALLDLVLVSGSPEMVEATGMWKPEHCTAGGLIHGGYLMAQADSVGAMCAFLNLPDGATTSTIESHTSFFRPVASGTITFVASPLHIGRSMMVIQTDITRDDGKAVGRTTQTQAVISSS